LYLASYFIFPFDIPVIVKFIAIVVLTAIGCFVIYDLIIKKVRWLRPLFGLKDNKRIHIDLIARDGGRTIKYADSLDKSDLEIIKKASIK
jgi:hypothetical protein